MTAALAGQWLTVVEIQPGFFVWIFFDTWRILSHVPPWFIQKLLEVDPYMAIYLFTWGLAMSVVAKRSHPIANWRDCKLQQGDPVDDSRARITLRLKA